MTTPENGSTLGNAGRQGPERSHNPSFGVLCYDSYMPIKDPEKRREVHRRYMKDVWYPNNRKKHIKLVHDSREKRRDVYANLKADLKVKCKCGEDHPAALDFHHRNSQEKDFEISVAIGWGYSWERILAEIAKCDVICSNCHRKLHWEEKKKNCSGVVA